MIRENSLACSLEREEGVTLVSIAKVVDGILPISLVKSLLRISTRLTLNWDLPRELCQAMERDPAQRISELERGMKELQEAVAALRAALLLHQIVTHAVFGATPH